MADPGLVPRDVVVWRDQLAVVDQVLGGVGGQSVYAVRTYGGPLIVTCADALTLIMGSPVRDLGR
jgi:hypothetical protein